MNKAIIGLALAAGSLLAQSTTLTLTGPATARAGATVPIALSVSGTLPVALQWTLAPPTGFSETAVVGSAASGVSKSITCTGDASFCLLFGVNVTLIPAGPVANYSLAVPANAAAGAVSLALTNVLAISSTGSSTPVTLGAPYSLLILGAADLNGDGIVDATDLQIMVTEVIASKANPGACVNDLNGDGKCDILDVIVIVLKILAGGH